jgi:hypothetical protein
MNVPLVEASTVRDTRYLTARSTAKAGLGRVTGMRHRGWLSGIALFAVASLLVSCRGVEQSEGEPDRTESVAVPGGTCDISWWLTPMVEDVAEEAKRTATSALTRADVSAAEWDEWHALLDGDPDNDNSDPVRLHGAAYLEVVRAEVRNALAAAGYPDTDRVIEVYSSLSCAKD